MHKLLLIFVMTFGILCLAGDSQEQQPLVLTTSMAPPLSKTDQSGYYDQILIEVFRRIGQPVQITHLPTERSIVSANMGLTDGEFPRISGLDRLYPNLLEVPEKIDDFDFAAFTWRSDIQLENWASCTPYNIAIVRGWKILESNLADAKSLVKVRNQNVLFAFLAARRTDIAVYSRFEGQEIIEQLDLQGVRALEPPLATKDMFLYLNEKHDRLIPALTEQLLSMKKDGTYDRIRKKTLGPYLKDAPK
jgi:polar amino acid transport system substrate-binding protein